MRADAKPKHCVMADKENLESVVPESFFDDLEAEFGTNSTDPAAGTRGNGLELKGG